MQRCACANTGRAQGRARGPASPGRLSRCVPHAAAAPVHPLPHPLGSPGLQTPRPLRTSSLIAASISGCSSDTQRYSASHGDATASAKKRRMAGPDKSSYTPAVARSLTVSTPKRASSPGVPALPPAVGAPPGAAIRGSAREVSWLRCISVLLAFTHTQAHEDSGRKTPSSQIERLVLRLAYVGALDILTGVAKPMRHSSATSTRR